MVQSSPKEGKIMYTLEEKIVGRFTVNLHHDEDVTAWDEVLCDEPIIIFTRDRWGRSNVQHDGTKAVQESMLDVLRLADESSWESVLDELDADYRYTDSGTLRVDSSSLKTVRYFKDAESAVRSVFRADFDAEFSDFRLHQFCTRDGWTYAVYSQSELDKYAGVKDAKAPVETIQSYLDGDVYGWTVEDADGDGIESCWGYIGDSAYCMAEGESFALHLESKELTKDASGIEASRPDLYAEA